METLLMSNEERKRMVLLTEVKKGGPSLAEAGRTMGVSYRQAKRIWRRFQKVGDSGLVHHSRGKPGPRRKKPKFRRQFSRVTSSAVRIWLRAAEKLQEEGLKADHET